VQAPGQQWQGRPTAADTAGAELTAYVPSEGANVGAIEQEASALTEATLDAPIRLATTGAEAAALTAAAGALVVGGAGSLLVARRSHVRV
jgi:LPXTG-motif cell wall-anchored protein